MTTSRTDIRYTVGLATESDIPRLAELLLELYRGECSEMIPRDPAVLTRLIEHTFRRDINTLNSTFVLRDRGSGGRIVASVVASTSAEPRTTPITLRHILRATRSARAEAARILWTQHRLAILLCASLPEKTTQLHSLIIDPEYRRHRLGTALVQAVENHARASGDDTVHLYILAGNNVENFYSRLGYRRTELGPPKRFVYPGIAMKKELHNTDRSK